MNSKLKIKKEIKEEECTEKSALCLVEFTNACLNKNQNSVKFDLYRGSITSEKNKRILVASTSRLTYFGANYQNKRFNFTSSVLKVAVFNKKTQKFKLYDVEYFVLRPILKGEISVETEEKSKLEQNQSLTLEFGGKSKKRSLSSMIKFESGEANETLNETVLQKISERPSLLPDTKLSSEPAPDDIIPQANKSATCPAEVYNIFDIIPRESFTALESEIGIFTDITREMLQTWKKTSKFSDIVLNYLEMNFNRLINEKAKLLCYIQYLIIFVNMKYTEWKKKDPLPEVPQPYRGSMMKRYLLNRSFPLRMKDKLLADLIILCLHLNQFSVDAMLLASSTKIGMQKLIAVAYALGCYVHSGKGETSKRFELKLPLYKHKPFGAKRL